LAGSIPASPTNYNLNKREILPMVTCNRKKLDLVNEIVFDTTGFLEKYKNNPLIYIVDTASSWIREYSTVDLAGYDILFDKHGYDGVKGNEYCEAKPSNSYKDKYGKVKIKLNGGGNFNDYTFERFEKDKNENLYMVISGFVEGTLSFILKFKFNSKNFINHISNRLNYLNENAKQSTRWTVKFSYLHYMNDDVILKYINKKLIQSKEEYFNGNFLNYLKKLGNF